MAIIKVNNLSISIGSQKKIEHASFDVNSGDVILLTGPNGCGKSTIIKMIMGDLFDYENIHFSAEGVIFDESHDIINSEAEAEKFRKHVCYVSQDDEFESDIVMDCFLMAINYDVKKHKERYVFDFVRKFEIQNCFGIDDAVRMDVRGKRLARKIGLKEHDMDSNDKKAVMYLSMNIKKMSGGQKKLTNIMSNLIRYEFSDIVLLDEPLNNLDYGNVRSFSNLLTSIYHSKPELGILLVTHCRSIPIVNRVIEIKPETRSLVETEKYACNSCFGELNEQGYYV